MSVPRTLVETSFAGPINEADQGELFDARAFFKTKENGRQNRRGGYSKRYGFTALTTTRYDTTSPTSGYKVFVDRDTTCRIVDNVVESYDVTKERWKGLGRVSECTCDLVDLPSLGAAGTTEDIEYCNGYYAVTYKPTDITVGVTVVNAATGAVVALPTLQVTGSLTLQPRLATYSTYFMLLVGDSSATEIKLYYLNTSTAATIQTGWVTAPAVATDITANLNFSVQSGFTSSVALVYVNSNATAFRITISTLTISGLLNSLDINTSSVTPDYLDVVGTSATSIWVAWNESTAVKVKGVDPVSLADTATTATIITSAATVNGVWLAESSVAGKGRLFVGRAAAPALTTYMRNFQTTLGATATDGSQIAVQDVRLFGRPIRHAGRYYAQAFFDTTVANAQKLAFLVDATEDVTYVRPVANPAPSLSVTSAAAMGRIVASGSELRFALSITRSGQAESAAMVVCDFANTRRWQAVACNRATYLSGGILMTFDGVRATEAGFLVRPKIHTTALGGTGITGTFRYVAVFEDLDASGNWHQSGVSDPTAAITPANETVTLSVTPLTITSRISSGGMNTTATRMVLYRTATGGLAPYYRLDEVINDTSLAALTYADAIADATLITRAKLYSQPGVLGTAQDRRAPPGLGIIATYNGMVVGAAGSDLWFSSQPVSGEGPWFNPIFQVPFDGEITALAPQDGTLYVFTRRNVYAISGDPPTDNGYGGLGVPQRLSADVGCIEARSVCSTSLGVFFQSERGLEVLTRARSVEWVGEAIQATLAAYPIVIAATVDASASVLYVELAAAESAGLVTGSGRTLVYDLSLKQWDSVDRRKNSAGTADTPAQSACMIYTGTAHRYAWLANDGKVYAEDRTTYLDSAAWVTMRVETGQIRITRGPEGTKIQGHQHISKALVLARRSTDHDLGLYAAYDHSTSYKTADTWTRAALATLTAAWPTEQLEYQLHTDAEGQGVQLKIEDATPTGGTVGTGQGATWIALTIEGTPRDGAALLPAMAR